MTAPAKWTKGPWVAQPSFAHFWMVDAQNGPGTVAHGCHEGDALRIVSCVNALEGVADPAAIPDVVKALRDAEGWIAERIEAVDELSYHGEALVCCSCGGRGTQAGFKSGVGNEPIIHASDCLIGRARAALARLEGK